MALALSAADGPLPIGELISLGLALWTIWEIVQLWDTIWEDAARQQQGEQQQGTMPAPHPPAAPSPQAHPASNPERSPREKCQFHHPSAMLCTEASGIDRDEVVVDFLMDEGFSPGDLGTCKRFDTFGPGDIDACDGAPGESWHCSVRDAGSVSVFGCLCCHEDGSTGFEWNRPHWSINMSRRGR